MNNAKEYYNVNSTDYVAKWDLSDKGLQKSANYYRLEIIKAILDLARINSKDNVIEIGCGTGLVLQELLKIKRPIYATDISIEMLNRVKDSLLKDKRVDIVKDFSNLSSINPNSEVYLMQNDLLELNLPKSYFDKIISMEVVRYIDDLGASLRNVRGVMKGDSVFVFTATNFFSFSLFPVKFTIRKLLNKINKDKELLQYFVTESSIKKTIRDSGLTVVGFKKMNLLAFNPLIEKIVHTASGGKRIQKIDSFLAKVPIINHLFDTFVVAVKRSNK